MSDSRIGEIKSYIQTIFGENNVPFFWSENEQKLPPIQVPAHVGRLLYLITKIKKPSRILEIGTLAGYSTLWMAKALEEKGKIVTIEIDPKRAEIAQKHFVEAGLEHQIDLRIGDAHVVLNQMIEAKEPLFDLIFLDADKESNPDYLPLIKQLAHHEAVILSDNLIPKWRPIEQPHPKDQIAQSTYFYNQMLTQDPELETAIMSTLVGTFPRIDGMGLSIYYKK